MDSPHITRKPFAHNGFLIQINKNRNISGRIGFRIIEDNRINFVVLIVLVNKRSVLAMNGYFFHDGIFRTYRNEFLLFICNHYN